MMPTYISNVNVIKFHKKSNKLISINMSIKSPKFVLKNICVFKC